MVYNMIFDNFNITVKNATTNKLYHSSNKYKNLYENGIFVINNIKYGDKYLINVEDMNHQYNENRDISIYMNINNDIYKKIDKNNFVNDELIFNKNDTMIQLNIKIYDNEKLIDGTNMFILLKNYIDKEIENEVIDYSFQKTSHQKKLIQELDHELDHELDKPELKRQTNNSSIFTNLFNCCGPRPNNITESKQAKNNPIDPSIIDTNPIDTNPLNFNHMPNYNKKYNIWDSRVYLPETFNEVVDLRVNPLNNINIDNNKQRVVKFSTVTGDEAEEINPIVIDKIHDEPEEPEKTIKNTVFYNLIDYDAKTKEADINNKLNKEFYYSDQITEINHKPEDLDDNKVQPVHHNILLNEEYNQPVDYSKITTRAEMNQLMNERFGNMNEIYKNIHESIRKSNQTEQPNQTEQQQDEQEQQEQQEQQEEQQDEFTII